MDVVVVAMNSQSTSLLLIVLFNINLGLVTILGIWNFYVNIIC
jgi:hypothetical protein